MHVITVFRDFSLIFIYFELLSILLCLRRSWLHRWQSYLSYHKVQQAPIVVPHSWNGTSQKNICAAEISAELLELFLKLKWKKLTTWQIVRGENRVHKHSISHPSQ